jgi:competence protein ComEA
MKNLFLAAGFGLASTLAFAGPVNINTADAKTLSKELVGVGMAKAERIVKYRAEKGPFQVAEDLKKVQGIGEATFEHNKTNIRLKD